jgi:tetratricopeptide (TPR) repeat protein
MPAEDAAALLRRATERHAAGDAAGAAALYHQVADGHPDQPAAWALLGGALGDAGDREGSVEAFERAARLAPDNDEIAVEHAAALLAAGRPVEAVAALSDRESHLAGSERAQAVLAEGYRATAQWDGAIACFTRLLDLERGNHAALVGRGVCRQQAGDLAGAIADYRQVVELAPGADEAWSNLGLALKSSGQPGQAVAALQRAVTLNPGNPATRCNLGVALQGVGRCEEAVEAFGAVLAADPDYADAWSNLGNARQDQCRLSEALEAHDRAVALAPDNAAYHWNRAMTLLLSGDFAAGFAEYEWRRRTAGHAPPGHDSPLWDGGDPAGRHILLLAEQGFGDAIQFARYAPLLRAMGADVTLRGPAKLARLFDTLPGGRGNAAKPADCHIPLMSLPHRLGTTPDTIPADIPYLSIPEGTAAPPPRRDRPRVGLCWTGNPGHPDNRTRSVPVANLAPLLTLPGIEWVSLQYGPGAEQATGLPLADWSLWLDGFDDTAAALSSLDLVISVDTATAHLAGALGLPVWLLLKFSPDWRWMLARDDSPWYPTMRLFRQDAPGDWAGVIGRVGLALDGFLEV